MQSLLLLIISIVALGIGPWVFHMARHSARVLKLLDGLVFLAVCGLVLSFITPEILASHSQYLLVVLILGFLIPTAIEYVYVASANNMHKAMYIIIALGLVIHGMFDGAALTIAPGHTFHSHELPYAVILHRLTMGLVIWRVFAGKPLMATLTLLGIAITTVLGYCLGLFMVHNFSQHQIIYLEAFISGALLHIVVHRLRSVLSSSK